jgi:hypothetical protein
MGTPNILTVLALHDPSDDKDFPLTLENPFRHQAFFAVSPVISYIDRDKDLQHETSS